MFYSKPFTKKEIIGMFINCHSGIPNELMEQFINHLDNTLNHNTLLKSFNKVMNIRIRTFAPNMFQIILN
jgi:hypothetical protein